MKTTAIAAVGAAMLGVLFCQSAGAKRDDYNIDQWRITNFKQELKLKAKRSALQAKKEQKKPALRGKPVSATAANEAKPPPAPQPAAEELATKQPINTKRAAAKRKLAPQGQAATKIADADGLPPYARANQLRFEQNKKTEIAAMIVSMAPCQKVPVWFALRVAMTESSLNPKVRGSAGEIGLFQLKCSTARLLGFSAPCKALYDARTNAYWGLKHLSLALQSAEGDARFAASKHNGGLGTTRLRREYVEQVMCSSAHSGFPSAYQLGASSEVARMCSKRRNRLNTLARLANDQDLQTASIAAIGSGTASLSREASLAQASDGCGVEDLVQPAVATAQTNAKPQQIAAKPADFARPFIVTHVEAKPQQISTRAINFVRPSFGAMRTNAKPRQAAARPLASTRPSEVAVETNAKPRQIPARPVDLGRPSALTVQASAASPPVPIKQPDTARPAILAAQTDANPQQTAAKQPDKSKTVTFVGSPSTPKSP